MKEKRFNLQFFAEGGDGSGTGTTGGNPGESASAGNGVGTQKEDLKSIVYGKQSSKTEETGQEPQKTKAQTFEDLIKGEYKEEFGKRIQGIIDERFKKSKGMEAELNSSREVLQRIAEKYGADAKDPKAILQALDNDESFYEKEALEKGLSVKQLKEMKALERENAQFKAAQAEAEKKAQSDKIYADWLDQGEKLKAKYGLQEFDLGKEAENPDFCRLLETGISVESAWKAIHIDEIVGGAMAQTANAVRQGIAQSINDRSGRPAESGASSNNSQIFKTDVRKLTKADRDEIERRVARGETISF